MRAPSSDGAILSLVICAAVSPNPAGASEPDRFQCLAQAYPSWVKRIRSDPATGRYVVEMRDHSSLPWDDGAHKTPEQRLDRPDLEDMLAVPYPEQFDPPPVDDPGRVRVDAFFGGLYGRTEQEVRSALEEVVWLPALVGTRVLFNRQHGAAAALRRVSQELERLPTSLHKYFKVTAGTFNRRSIAGTDRLSAHSWGIAIDLNVEYSDYWRWNLKRGALLQYRNRIPPEIVRAFERHGFIWGGKWYHFDTMHFEYRPELLHPTCLRQVQTKESRK